MRAVCEGGSHDGMRLELDLDEFAGLTGDLFPVRLSLTTPGGMEHYDLVLNEWNAPMTNAFGSLRYRLHHALSPQVGGEPAGSEGDAESETP